MKLSLTDFRAFAATGMLDVRPMTFLVGENSSGKTSFLAALNYIWQLRGRSLFSPSFNRPPFDLGTFEEIVHRAKGKGKPECFRLELAQKIKPPRRPHNAMLTPRLIEGPARDAKLTLIFESDFGESFISKVMFEYENYMLSIDVKHRFKAILSDKNNNEYIYDIEDDRSPFRYAMSAARLETIGLFDAVFWLRRMYLFGDNASPKNDGNAKDEALSLVLDAFEWMIDSLPIRTFASAPVRSNPSRVYTFSDQSRSPDGAHVPQTLIKIKESDERRWTNIKKGLERFGKASGMFNEINVQKYRSSGSSPFQINIVRNGKRSNIVDVGYGVSQALPILIDLIEGPRQSGFLFQQPEVHLHPQAQAALGSFFVEHLAQSPGSTIVAETHSDYLIDRIRVCVMQKKIKSSDVSILYFESIGGGANVHQISVDNEGNIVNTPENYRDFFVKEQMKLLGLEN